MDQKTFKAFLIGLQALKTVLSQARVNITLDENFVHAFNGRRSALLAYGLSDTKPVGDGMSD